MRKRTILLGLRAAMGIFMARSALRAAAALPARYGGHRAQSRLSFSKKDTTSIRSGSQSLFSLTRNATFTNSTLSVPGVIESVSGIGGRLSRLLPLLKGSCGLKRLSSCAPRVSSNLDRVRILVEEKMAENRLTPARRAGGLSPQTLRADRQGLRSCRFHAARAAIEIEGGALDLSSQNGEGFRLRTSIFGLRYCPRA